MFHSVKLLAAVISLALFVTVAVIAGAGPALAGGLYVSEFATSDMGAAGSGTLAGASRSGAVVQNPAAMLLLDSHNLHMGLAPGVANVKFDQKDDARNDGNNGGSQADFVPLISSGYVHKLHDRVRLGLGAFSISGAALDPKGDWAGRSQVTEISLFTLTILPTVGVRVTDWLSVGVGPFITFATLDWKLRLPLPVVPAETEIKLDDLDDWGVAALVGVLIQPNEDIEWGIVYQSKTNLTLSGDGKADVPALSDSVTTKLNFDLPQAVRSDIHWQAFEQVGLSFGAAWEDWGSLENTRIRLGQIDESVRLGFKDSYKLRTGIHWQYDEKHLFQTGVSFDSSAMRSQDRIAALPVDKQWRWGIGGRWQYSPGTRIGYSFQYTNLGKARIDNASLRGKYKNNEIFFFQVSLNMSDLPWNDRGTW